MTLIITSICLAAGAVALKFGAEFFTKDMDPTNGKKLRFFTYTIYLGVSFLALFLALQ